MLLLTPLLIRPSFAATHLPYKLRFIAGQKQGERFTAGLHISMTMGWKTYWRVPGAGGVPPQIDVMGENVKSFTVGLPAPQRFQGADGESIGFKDEVVFPILIETKTAATELKVNLSAFIGVCDEVCIPVPVNVAMTLQENSNEAAMVARAFDVVPKLVEAGPVESLMADGQGLRFKLRAMVRDIFVEAGDAYYVKAPMFDLGVLPLAGTKTAADLKGKTLRITSIDENGVGLEQMLVVQ